MPSLFWLPLPARRRVAVKNHLMSYSSPSMISTTGSGALAATLKHKLRTLMPWQHVESTSTMRTAMLPSAIARESACCWESCHQQPECTFCRPTFEMSMEPNTKSRCRSIFGIIDTTHQPAEKFSTAQPMPLRLTMLNRIEVGGETTRRSAISCRSQIPYGIGGRLMFQTKNNATSKQLNGLPRNY